MMIKRLLVPGLRAILLTILLFVCFAVAAAVAGQDVSSEQSAEQQSSAALWLLAVCFLNSLVTMYIIARSRWSGLRLVLTIFVVHYGVTTVMSQIESAIFITRLPEGTVPSLFVMGAVISALFSPLAVLVMGKWKQATDGENNLRLVMPASEWVWKLSAIAILYVILYFTFGYFIAWTNPSVRQYYGAADPEGFFAHLFTVFRDTPWLFAIQAARGIFWALLALPVIRMMKGEWWEAALAVSLLFSVVMNAQLLLPNPFMPEDVRMAHLIETASSNFILGWVIVWLLARRRISEANAKLSVAT